MKYAVEMGSGAKFHKDWFSHSKVDKGDMHTDRQQGDLIRLLYFFQARKVGSKGLVWLVTMAVRHFPLSHMRLSEAARSHSPNAKWQINRQQKLFGSLWRPATWCVCMFAPWAAGLCLGSNAELVPKSHVAALPMVTPKFRPNVAFQMLDQNVIIVQPFQRDIKINSDHAQ
jgi:hypothetical protein